MRAVLAENEAGELIREAFPDFDVRSVRLEGAGWDNRAFTVNDELVFRFPQFEQVLPYLEREIQILPQLAALSPVPLPRIEFIGKRGRNQPFLRRFVGYRRLAGAALDARTWNRLSGACRERAVEQLAGFLEVLRDFPVDRASTLGVGREHHRKRVLDLLETGRSSVFALLSACERESIEGAVGAYLDDEACFDYRPALLHADLAGEHILWDAVTERVSGILDFGDVVIGDPDFDLTGPYAEYGPEFIRLLLRHRPRKDARLLFKKLNAIAVCGAINAFAHRPNQADPAARDAALARLRALAV